MDAQASPAKKADDPPKSPQLKHVTIRNDDGGKATCALGYEGKFDNAGLTITYDSAHASDVQASLSVSPPTLQTVLSVASSSAGTNTQGLAQAFRIDFMSLTPAQQSLRLAGLIGQAISVNAAGKKSQTGTLTSVDANNNLVINPGAGAAAVSIPQSAVEQITLDTAAFAANPGNTIQVSTTQAGAATDGKVAYRFATTPWNLQFRVTLSQSAGASFSAYLTLTNPTIEDWQDVKLTLQQGAAQIILEKLQLKKGETRLYSIPPPLLESWNAEIRIIKSSELSVDGNPQPTLIFDATTQPSGQSPYEFILFSSSVAIEPYIKAATVLVDDVNSGLTFTGSLAAPDERLAVLIDDKVKADPTRKYRYLTLAPSPEVTVNYLGPVARFGKIFSVTPATYQLVTNLANLTTFEGKYSASKEKSHLAVLDASRRVLVLPAQIVGSTNDPPQFFLTPKAETEAHASAKAQELAGKWGARATPNEDDDRKGAAAQAEKPTKLVTAEKAKLVVDLRSADPDALFELANRDSGAADQPALVKLLKQLYPDR